MWGELNISVSSRAPQHVNPEERKIQSMRVIFWEFQLLILQIFFPSPFRNNAQRNLIFQSLGLLHSHEHHRPSGLLPERLSNHPREEQSILLCFKHLPEVPDLGIISLEGIPSSLKCSLWLVWREFKTKSLSEEDLLPPSLQKKCRHLSAQYEPYLPTQGHAQEWTTFLLLGLTL